MILDKFNRLDAAHAYTATAISTNVFDLGPVTNNLTRDLGAGTPLRLTILIDTSVAASGGASTTVWTLESDDNTSLSSATVHWTSASIAKATMVAGYFVAQAMPLPHGNYERYVGIRATISTNNWTAGAASAWLHYGAFDLASVAYASGFTSGY